MTAPERITGSVVSSAAYESWRSVLGRVGEGVCPLHQRPLDPEAVDGIRLTYDEDCEVWRQAPPVGWCDACQVGYRMDADSDGGEPVLSVLGERREVEFVSAMFRAMLEDAS